MTDQQDFATVAKGLSALDHLGVAELELLYKLERTAGRLYELLADAVGNDEAAALLRRNGREELGHAARTKRALARKLGHDWTPTAELEELYPLALPPAVGPDLLEAIIVGEQAGDADYQRWADHEPDPEIAELLRRNGAEETGHGERATRAAAILRAG